MKTGNPFQFNRYVASVWRRVPFFNFSLFLVDVKIIQNLGSSSWFRSSIELWAMNPSSSLFGVSIISATLCLKSWVLTMLSAGNTVLLTLAILLYNCCRVGGTKPRRCASFRFLFIIFGFAWFLTPSVIIFACSSVHLYCFESSLLGSILSWMWTSFASVHSTITSSEFDLNITFA